MVIQPTGSIKLGAWIMKDHHEGMRWLQNFKYHDSDLKNDPKEFYELAKNDLYREDIVVFSPHGDTYLRWERLL